LKKQKKITSKGSNKKITKPIKRDTLVELIKNKYAASSEPLIIKTFMKKRKKFILTRDSWLEASTTEKIKTNLYKHIIGINSRICIILD
jgi:serine protease inhibitor